MSKVGRVVFDVDLCIDHNASLQKISEGQADSFTR